MINKIKEKIKCNKDNNVKLIYNGSRNRREEYNGVIKEVYNNVFIVKLDTDEIKCFSYSDILTNTVEIFFDKL